MVDTPEEAMAMMQILKSAGLGDKMPDMKRPDMPMKQDMENEQDEIEQGADYRNSPDEKYDDDALVEEFIEGKEYYVGVFGKKAPTALPVWELVFGQSQNPEKEVYSSRAKFSQKFRAEQKIKTQKAKIDSSLEKSLQKTAKEAFKALELSGYARVDFRLSAQGVPYILEINANPGIGQEDEFALSAQSSGLSYAQLLKKLIQQA